MGKITAIIGISAMLGGLYLQWINITQWNHGYHTTSDQFFLGSVSILISLVLIIGGIKLIIWGRNSQPLK